MVLVLLSVQVRDLGTAISVSTGGVEEDEKSCCLRNAKSDG